MPSTDSEIKIFGTGTGYYSDRSNGFFGPVKHCIFILQYEGPENVAVPAYINPGAINLRETLGMDAMKKL